MEEISNGEPPTSQYKIKIFGVGGAGCKIVDSLRKNKKFSAEYYFVDDDPNDLAEYKNATQIWVGAEPHDKRTYEYGKKAGREFKRDIDHAVYKADLVVIVAGIGGAIGAGTSVAIAEIAKENKIPTAAVVCSPFSFESKSRNGNAEQSLSELRKIGVSTVVVPCEKIKEIVPKTTVMRDALNLAQTMAVNALNALLAPLISSSAVNLDFFETVALLRKSNNIYFGFGEGGGKERVIESVRFAVNCPMAESPFENITGVILYIEGGDDLAFDEISEVATLVRAATDSSVNIMFASNIDSKLTGKIRVSILATKPNIVSEYIKTIEREPNTEIDVTVNHSAELHSILEAAEAAAEEYGSTYIGSEHLIYAMLDNECIAGKVLKACKVNVVQYEAFFKKSIDSSVTLKGFTPRTKHMIEQAGTFARDIDGEGVTAGTEHLLLAIISYPECLAMRILKAIDVDLQKLASTLEKVLRASGE